MQIIEVVRIHGGLSWDTVFFLETHDRAKIDNFGPHFLLFLLDSLAFSRICTMLIKCFRIISATRAFLKMKKNLKQKVQKGKNRALSLF